MNSDASFRTSTVTSLRAPRANNVSSGPSSTRADSPVNRNLPAPVETTFVLDDDDFAEDLAALQEIEEAESNLKV
jgi:hypothetical protein